MGAELDFDSLRELRRIAVILNKIDSKTTAYMTAKLRVLQVEVSGSEDLELKHARLDSIDSALELFKQ